MYRFDIDITPIINGKKCHLEGICEMQSTKTFTVTMTKPFEGLTITKHFDGNEIMEMDNTFVQVETYLQELYKQDNQYEDRTAKY